MKLELRSKMGICSTTDLGWWLCRAGRPKYNKQMCQKREARAFRLCRGCSHVTSSLGSVSVGWAVHTHSAHCWQGSFGVSSVN